MAPKYSVFAAFLLILFRVGADVCRPARCSEGGPEVRFPFRLKSRQPQHCGYNPGFDLYCSELNQTLFQIMGSSEKFMVEDIGYASQRIKLQHPSGCYPQNYQFFSNLTSSPFQFYSDSMLINITMLNCSSTSNFYPSCVCLENLTYRIYAVLSLVHLEAYNFVSCTKLYEVSSVPNLFYYAKETSIVLEWFAPACGHCESQGKTCSMRKSNTGGHQLLCKEEEEPKEKQGNWRKRLLILVETLGPLLFVVTMAFLYCLYGSIRANKEHQMKIESFLEDYKALKPTRFSYVNLRKITNEFSEKLGEGGYGIVYRGKLSSEIYVAVKVLNNSLGNGEEFVNEVGTIGRIHHVNVVRLVGYCADGLRRALVYEFLPNDSLEKFIFSEGPKRRSLCREKIQDIALGVAKGIEYLHQGCEQQILHFDIKPNNILLDHNFNPKICDFGLAKLCSKEQSAVSMTVARGTMGYIAPEVLSRTFGKVSSKSDVYSFGMLLLEMVGGRKNTDHSTNTSQAYFPQWVYNRLSGGEEISVDIEEEDDESNIARKLIMVGLMCIQWHPNDRPCMKSVVRMLESDGNNLAMPPNPFPTVNTPNAIPRMRLRHYQTELEIISELE